MKLWYAGWGTFMVICITLATVLGVRDCNARTECIENGGIPVRPVDGFGGPLCIKPGAVLR